MAVTGVETYKAIIEDALILIEAGTLGISARAEAMTHGILAANRILKRWSGVERLQCFTTEISISLTAATASYSSATLGRPAEIHNIRYRDSNSIDIPMIQMSTQEYYELPDKTSAGIPTQWMYDKQKESPTLFVWPVKATVTTEALKLTVYRESDDISAETDTVDLAVEGYEAFTMTIAERLAPVYGKASSSLKYDALQARKEFFAGDNEGMLVFGGWD